MRLLLAALFAFVAAAAPASAQIAGPPNVFVTGAVIDAGQMNANFAAIYTAALNRTGGTMSGNLLFSPDNTYDVGGSGTSRPRDLNLARNAVIAGTLAVTGATTLTGALGVNNALTVTSTTSPQFLARYDSSNRVDLSVSSAGAVTFNAVGAGAGFNFSDPMAIAGALSTTSTINATGAITSAATVSSTSGVLLSTNTGPAWKLFETDAAADERLWRTVASAAVGSFQACNDAESACGTVWTVGRTGTTVNSFNVMANATTFSSAAGTARWSVDASGHFVPGADGTYNIGAASFGVDSLYLDVATSDPNPQIRLDNDTDTGIGIDASGFFFVKDGARVFSVTNAGVTTIPAFSSFLAPSQNFAGLTGLPNGTIYYCSDCTVANPCAGAGGGALAKRIAGAWVCN